METMHVHVARPQAVRRSLAITSIQACTPTYYCMQTLNLTIACK